MSNKKSTIYLFSVLILSATLTFWGCNNKTDKPDDQSDDVKTEMENPDTSPDNTPDGTDIESENKETVEEPMVAIPDIKGTYSGTFDKRTTVLNITEQTDSSFSGKISIKYREMLNQDVKGTFSPTTNKITMADQIHSHFMGKYDGKLIENNTKLSGIFTMNSDGKQYTFNLTKK